MPMICFSSGISTKKWYRHFIIHSRGLWYHIVSNISLPPNTQPGVNKGIKTGSGGVCCHNARGRVRNRKSNPEGVSPRDLTYCSHKPECIVTTKPDRSVLITIITWHFQFRPVNVSILHLKDDYRVRSESRFACYSHCYVTWCPLTTGIVASQCPSARDAVLVTRYITPFISACLSSFLRFLPQYHIFTKDLQT